MEWYVGTSGYSYKEWKGTFYPADLSPKKMLPFYAKEFRSVEINNTFHRMPSAPLMQGWAGEVPRGFKFSLKAPQRITHFRRLLDAGETVSFFLDVAALLNPHLGAILFQLPPDFRKDLPRLRDFLCLLPPGVQVSFEFRHASWFDDDVIDLLSRHRVALCLADTESELRTPLVRTAPFGYLRLRRPGYSDAELEGWVHRVQRHEWDAVFIYFKHEDEAQGVRSARRFLELASRQVHQ